MRRGVLVAGMVAVFAGVATLCSLGRVWADDAPAAVDYTKILPADLVKNTPQGKLVNPYKDTQADVVAEGGKFLAELFLQRLPWRRRRRRHVPPADQRHLGVRRR